MQLIKCQYFPSHNTVSRMSQNHTSRATPTTLGNKHRVIVIRLLIATVGRKVAIVLARLMSNVDSILYCFDSFAQGRLVCKCYMDIMFVLLVITFLAKRWPCVRLSYISRTVDQLQFLLTL